MISNGIQKITIAVSTALVATVSSAFANACLENGGKFFSEGNFRQAVMALEKCKQDPQSWRMLGISYYQLSYMEEAKEFLKKAISQNSDSLGLKIKYAHALGLNKEFKKSLEEYKKLHQAHASDTAVHKGYAQILGWSRMYEQAIAEYRSILKLNPTDYDAMIQIGIFTSWNKKFKEAVAEFTKIIDTKPPTEWEIKARFHRAEVMSWQKKFDESVVEFQEIIRIEPQSIDAYLGAGQVREWQSNYKDARKFYEKALEADPENKTAKGRLTLLMWVK